MSAERAAIALALSGNALNLAYNVPLVYLVVKKWDADNLSKYYIALRVSGSVAWIAYAGVTEELWVGVSYCVTLLSSLILAYVKMMPRPTCDTSV